MLMPFQRTHIAVGKESSGFTLIELLITMAVIGVLTSIALPSLRSFMAGQRIKSAAFDLMSMITLTRSEAVKRNTDVTLNLDPTTNTFTIVAAGSTTPIRTQEMFAGITLNCINASTHAVVSCGTSGIVYSSNGRLASAFYPLQISSTDNANPSTRCISIDLSGRPNSKKGAC